LPIVAAVQDAEVSEVGAQVDTSRRRHADADRYPARGLAVSHELAHEAQTEQRIQHKAERKRTSLIVTVYVRRHPARAEQPEQNTISTLAKTVVGASATRL
jgi:hypothetical protein